MKENIEAKKQQVIKELYRQAIRKFKHRRVVIKGLMDLYQADLIFMDKYSRDNNGFKYLLTVINCFSKYAWAIPLKRKTSAEVSKAFETILKEHGAPKNLQCDQGKLIKNI